MIFPASNTALRTKPALRELNRQRAKAAWKRWNKEGDPPNMNPERLLSDLEAHGYDTTHMMEILGWRKVNP